MQASASLKDLQKMDMWSFGMVLFCILNPDVPYPYYIEAKKERQAGRIVDKNMSKQLLEHECLPQSSSTYDEMSSTGGKWGKIAQTMGRCLKFNPAERINATNIVSLLNHHLSFHPCIISQDSQAVAYNSGTVTQNLQSAENACTFLSLLIADKLCTSPTLNLTPAIATEILTNTILNFSRTINEHRNVRDMYAVDSALNILQRINEIHHEYSLVDLIPEQGYMDKHNASVSLHSGLEELCTIAMSMTTHSTITAVYTCPPYTFLLAAVKDAVFVFDTHPVTADHGGNGEAMVVHVSLGTTGQGVSSLTDWLLNRVILNRRVLQHALTWLKQGQHISI